MPTNLEKAKRNRIRVTQYYANAWQFIIRLLMGLGVYIVLRIGLYAFLSKVQAIDFAYGDAIAELFVLLVSALLMILLIWIKGTRSHLAAAIWMPVMACLIFSNLIAFIHLLIRHESTEAWLGYLPFLLPLLLMVIYWIFDPEILWLKLTATIVFLAMAVFWVTDIPKTFKEARNVQAVVKATTAFAADLQEEHIVSRQQAPVSLQAGNVRSVWHTHAVNPGDYRIDEEIKDVIGMSYVSEADIIIRGLNADAKISSQELRFGTLEHISLHYFFKYATTRHIVIKDFQYTGDAFFILELRNGEIIIADNVLIRKKSKEKEGI